MLFYIKIPCPVNLPGPQGQDLVEAVQLPLLILPPRLDLWLPLTPASTAELSLWKIEREYMKTYIQQMYKITLEKLKQPAKNTWRLVLFYKHCTSHVISLWKCCAQIQSIYSRFTFLFPQESFNASDFILCFLEFGLKITVVLIQLHQRTHFIWKTKHTYYQQQQQYYIKQT